LASPIPFHFDNNSHATKPTIPASKIAKTGTNAFPFVLASESTFSVVVRNKAFALTAVLLTSTFGRGVRTFAGIAGAGCGLTTGFSAVAVTVGAAWVVSADWVRCLLGRRWPSVGSPTKGRSVALPVENRIEEPDEPAAPADELSEPVTVELNETQPRPGSAVVELRSLLGGKSSLVGRPAFANGARRSMTSVPVCGRFSAFWLTSGR
jgi:hypothetical protein